MSSGALDQILLEDIARGCPKPFLAYHRCMSLAEPDPTNCLEEQKALAACIKSDVPAFKRIQNECAAKLSAYEGCLKKNSSVRSKCVTQLNDLRSCASGTVEK